MDRRRFLLTWLAGALAAPLAAGAQQAEKVRRIGYLAFASSPPDEDAFRAARRELGYVEGKNLVLEYRWASPDPARFRALAVELVTLGVDVIVAVTNGPVLAAQTVTTTIPIVALLVIEPRTAGEATICTCAMSSSWCSSSAVP